MGGSCTLPGSEGTSHSAVQTSLCRASESQGHLRVTALACTWPQEVRLSAPPPSMTDGGPAEGAMGYVNAQSGPGHAAAAEPPAANCHAHRVPVHSSPCTAVTLCRHPCPPRHTPGPADAPTCPSGPHTLTSLWVFPAAVCATVVCAQYPLPPGQGGPVGSSELRPTPAETTQGTGLGRAGRSP